MIDVVVVGGGPAGLATALCGARAGLEVVVVERRGGVIDKACGEGLMPGAIRALDGLDIEPRGHRLDGICYVAAGRRAAAAFEEGPGRGVRRTVLHSALRDAVLAAGVRIDNRTAGDVSQDDSGVRVDGTRARYLVAADGLHSTTRSAVGLDGRGASVRRYGISRHFRVRPWTSFVEVHWAEGVEAYVTPLADDSVGVAVLTKVRGGFDTHLASFPEIQERLEDAEAVDSTLGAGPLWRRSTSRVAGRALLVGDAAGYVDALTGEGVALALTQAQAAIRAITADDPGRYEREWRRITRTYRLMTSALVVASQVPALRTALVPAAARLPRVFAAAVNAMATSS